MYMLIMQYINIHVQVHIYVKYIYMYFHILPLKAVVNLSFSDSSTQSGIYCINTRHWLKHDDNCVLETTALLGIDWVLYNESIISSV